MRVEELALESFRNYERAEVTFDPGLNVVVGRNAQGKTNLLEAVHCLSGLGSPRGSDAAVISEGAERALLHATVVRGTRTIRIDLEIRTGRGSRALLNQTPVAGTRALSEVAVSVFFGPDELSLVKGSPDRRRRFLDDLVVKLRPARADLRREWERVLKQRNALLKSAPRSLRADSLPTLEVWDESLARVGAALTAARLDALNALAPFTQKRYESIAGGGRIELGYASSWVTFDMTEPGAVDEDALRDRLTAAIEENRRRELERGLSLVGPHRDDVAVILTSAGDPGAHALDARAYASQGDQRTCALGLKLGEFDLLTDALDEEPILLLDDVFSELDPARRAWLADSVRGAGQTILTSAEPGATDAAGEAKVIEVVAGRLDV